METLENALGAVSFFAPLRPDEIGRIARRCQTLALPAGATREFCGAAQEAQWLLVVSGKIELFVEGICGEVRTRMRPGDSYGEAALLGAQPHRLRVHSQVASELALINRSGFEAILSEFPVVALPLASELASELRAKNDQVRQLLELQAARLPADQFTAQLRSLQRILSLRGAPVRRHTVKALFRRLVAERGNEPPFWVLLGFLLALLGARLTVFLILHYGLEKQLFALVAGTGPNPMHIHHFNYGLALVGVSGLAALFPSARRTLRLLLLTFGAGCGLIFDEFALFWNLNPDYAQGLSLISAAIVGISLVQLTYFRRFWLALAARTAQRIRAS